MSAENNVGASMEAIQYHYDVSNDFYRFFLDTEMSYSCALWYTGQESLDVAQQQKIDYHIDNLELNPAAASRVLDIGCGWGAVMRRVKQRYALSTVTGITLSDAQVQHIDTLNLTDITATLENWQDHQAAKGTYDGIISVGAFEHFATPEASQEEKIQGYRNFFTSCYQWLKPSGIISLQTIGAGNMKREDLHHFFATEIFPESDLPRLADIATASTFLFEIVSVRNDREMYANTLREWLKNLQGNKQTVVNTFGTDLFKKYEKYFSLLILAFDVYKSMDLYRIKLRKIDKPRQ
ncbi:class I SAM-dependent methyltransferase [Chitinophaga nivalis]|uniref:Class I SAM-dependent methyltransferase n=1 Tax=Chitinophaga nivalis TaxID=2991709 RepID=A0ABT3IMS1_9BACT|nr:class I SAM-dependent methyltransferase [Chitinophaga nivalis]MCW3465040.1 class I SAM-dependent methyltransferase [Chitinophaga nivalis]MCW3485268.1 class I SAM-dependent methyltransferase [Chitinophaga nivalis]